MCHGQPRPCYSFFLGGGNRLQEKTIPSPGGHIFILFLILGFGMNPGGCIDGMFVDSHDKVDYNENDIEKKDD